MYKKKYYRYLIPVAIICALLIVIFLWQENFDIHQKINDQKFSNFFVSLFTAIGTLATILFAIKQYELSELTNRTAIKPDIFPNNYFFKMEDDEEPLDIPGIEPDLFLTHAFPIVPDHKLLIKNIGVGIAKNIKIKWLYDEMEVENLIRGKYYRTPEDKEKHIPYLNPNIETEINLPSAYLSCCGPKLFEKFEMPYFSNMENMYVEPSSEQLKRQFQKWKNQTFAKKRPSLTLEIKFTDIQNLEYKKTFETEVSGVRDMVTFNFK